MKRLRKQIRESFFNPVLHLLPILLFLVMDEFFGLSVAWKVSFPVAAILLIYIYYVCNQLFTWHVIFTLVFIAVTLTAGILYIFPLSVQFQHVFYEVIVIVFLLTFIIFRPRIQRLISKISSSRIPMSNNFNEMYRVIWAFVILLSAYVVANIFLILSNTQNYALFQRFIQYVYLSILAFLVFYEIMRVLIVRASLIREEWWPIVNDKGKIVGSVQNLVSLQDEKIYMHPVIRVVLIDHNLILLQKRTMKSNVFAGLWDTAITNHLKMGETVDQCIEHTAHDRYGLINFEYMYLSNYMIELHNEKNYAFLFVSCNHQNIKPNSSYIEQVKWWTRQQIEENIETGIFSDSFKLEFEIMKRSGLLESFECNCDCRIKDIVFGQHGSMH